MAEPHTDIITLKPRWSLSDLFGRRGQAKSRARILRQLDEMYLSEGWQLADDILWGKGDGFAVMKVGRPTVS
ncbi:MAG TPA: hypothetical protein VLE70_14470 [Anaerolineae bacterium]|nr:hypothetical protein [Anaerolineae bacterium]